MQETIGARKLLKEASLLELSLKAALEEGRLEMLEHAVAAASYAHVVHLEFFQLAFDRMLELGSEAGSLFSLISTGVRTGNRPLLKHAKAEMRRVGWHDEVISDELLDNLLTARDDVIVEESIRTRLVKVALNIKSGQHSGVGEVLQLMRRSLTQPSPLPSPSP